MKSSRKAFIPFRYFVSVTQWGLLDSSGKYSNFQKLFRMRLRSKFLAGETTRPTDDDENPAS